MDGYVVVPKETQKGFATKGDSGSGALYRFSDGSLRNVGTLSSGDTKTALFIRLDNESFFLKDVIIPGLLCGKVDDKGICIGDVLATCGRARCFLRLER